MMGCLRKLVVVKSHGTPTHKAAVECSIGRLVMHMRQYATRSSGQAFWFALFTLTACIELPEPGTQPGTQEETSAQNAERETIIMLDVASDISVTPNAMTLSWNGAPLPGSILHFIIQRPARHLATSAAPVPRARIAYAEPGHVWSDTVTADSSVSIVPDGDNTLLRLSVTIPQNIPPGPIQLMVTIGDITLAPIALEVANPDQLEPRSAAFARAKAVWAATADNSGLSNTPPQNIQWAAFYSPLPVGGVLAHGATGEQRLHIETNNTWMFEVRTIAENQQQPSLRQIVANPNGVLLLNEDSPDLVLQDEQGGVYAPVPDGSYNGWFWHPDGSTQTFPPPGTDIPISIGSYNGWFWHPDGNVRRQPPAEDGTPRAPGSQERPDPVTAPGTTPPMVPPTSPVDGGKTVFTPEEFFPGIDLTQSCSKDFSESLPNFNYRSYFLNPIRDRAHGRPRENGTIYSKLPPQFADVYFSIADTSRPPQPPTALRPFAWTPARVADTIERTIRWYANHCVYLTFRRVDPPEFTDPRVRKNAMSLYKNWLVKLTGLGVDKTITNEAPDKKVDVGIRVFAGLEAATRSVIRERFRAASPRRTRKQDRAITRYANGVLTVIFLDRLVDLNAREADAPITKRRPTEASLAITGRNTIAMHGNDADDPYVLTHELIHALGRPYAPGNTDLHLLAGAYSWGHSTSPEAMSHLVRRTLNVQSGLHARRRWVFAEYIDASLSGQLRGAP